MRRREKGSKSALAERGEREDGVSGNRAGGEEDELTSISCGTAASLSSEKERKKCA